MFRALLRRIALRIYYALEAMINRLKIGALLANVTISPSSRIYEQAKIHNFQNNPAKIRIGKGTHVRGELLIFANGGEIVVGDNCYIGEGSRIWSGERITIGNNVLIAHNVNIVDTNAHEMNHLARAAGFQKLVKEGHPKIKTDVATAPVSIGDYAWISFNVCILKGVRVGTGAIVAGGSVVTDDVPEFTLVAGNPARIARKLDE